MPLVVTQAPDDSGVGTGTSLVTVPQYRRLSGDQASSNEAVTQNLFDAQRLIEEYLERPLAASSILEDLEVYEDIVYPSATPVLSSTGGSVVSTQAVQVFQTSVVSSPARVVKLPYVGGYTASTLPLTLAKAIVDTARSLSLSASATDAPVGAISVRIGDAAVNYGKDGAGASYGTLKSSVVATISRYRRKRVVGS